MNLNSFGERYLKFAHIRQERKEEASRGGSRHRSNKIIFSD